MGSIRVFLDANILFSAALGGSAFKLLWDLAKAGKLELLTTSHCRIEAKRNLEAKKPTAIVTFDQLCEWTVIVPSVRSFEDMPATLPEKDIPVYASAVAAKAEVLITGDTKHFGELMKRDDLPLRVQTLKDFLLTYPNR